MERSSIAAAALLLCVLASCGSDAKVTGPISPSRDAGVVEANDARDGGTQEEPLFLRGTVLDLASMTPLSRVAVRVFERPEFGEAITNTKGAYELGPIPEGEEVVVQFDAEGMYPMLSHIISASPDTRELGPLLMFSASGALLFMRASGELVDSGLATVGGVFQDITTGARHGVSGATFSIAPPSGSLVYLGENDVPEPSRTNTASDGAAAALNVTPGEYLVGFEAPGLECRSTSSEMLDGARVTRRARAVAGYFTNFGAITCQ